MRDSDRSVDDGSPSGFKAFVVCRHDYGSSPVISFLAMRGLTLIIGLQKTLIFFARRHRTAAEMERHSSILGWHNPHPVTVAVNRISG